MTNREDFAAFAFLGRRSVCSKKDAITDSKGSLDCRGSSRITSYWRKSVEVPKASSTEPTSEALTEQLP